MSIGIRKTFNLDMVPGGAPPVIHVSAGDVGRPFRANLLYSGETYGLDAVTSVKIRGTKPDKTVFEYALTFDAEDSHVDFIIEEQMAIIAGPVLCEIRLFSGEDTIGSANFILDVETAVYDPEAASESYIPSFETAIQEALENVADDIAELATAAAINDVKQYSDAASASATAAAGSATSAQTSAGTAAASAEDAEEAADRAEAAADSILVDVTDRTPYLLRQSGGGIETGDREYDTIVGGTVAWNQLVDDPLFTDSSKVNARASSVSLSDGVATVTPTSDGTERGGNFKIGIPLLAGHKYLLCTYMKVTTSGTIKIGNNGGDVTERPITSGAWQFIGGIITMSATSANPNASFYQKESITTSDTLQYKTPLAFDLTQMFGSTIADYIYNLEQATAGAGVAWFRQFFPEDYYAYNAGELLSVSGVSAHVMRDANDNIIGNYPLDDSLTLRGLPKLDGGKLYYDGDTYEADGTVTRKYGVRAYQSGDESLADAITDGTNTVYKLTTPTTETADPFTNPQVVDQNGTEQYVTDSIVPVGHDTRYRVNIANKVNQILEAPSTNGTYTLKCTVSNGEVTYFWQ